MDDRTRRVILSIFAILVIIGFAFAFNSNSKANENRLLFEKEMAFRLDMEEKVTKLRSEKMELAAALKDRDLELQRKDQLAAELNQAVIDQKETLEILQLELKGMTLLKEQLENNLKAELSQRKQ